jgi:hypothetical protein
VWLGVTSWVRRFRVWGLEFRECVARGHLLGEEVEEIVEFDGR